MIIRPTRVIRHSRTAFQMDLLGSGGMDEAAGAENVLTAMSARLPLQTLSPHSYHNNQQNGRSTPSKTFKHEIPCSIDDAQARLHSLLADIHAWTAPHDELSIIQSSLIKLTGAPNEMTRAQVAASCQILLNIMPTDAVLTTITNTQSS